MHQVLYIVSELGIVYCKQTLIVGIHTFSTDILITLPDGHLYELQHAIWATSPYIAATS